VHIGGGDQARVDSKVVLWDVNGKKRGGYHVPKGKHLPAAISFEGKGGLFTLTIEKSFILSGGKKDGSNRCITQ